VPIRDWHFWKDGEQITVYSGWRDSPGTYALYDTASARLIEKLAEPSDEKLLPQWAKGQAQIHDESVPIERGPDAGTNQNGLRKSCGKLQDQARHATERRS